MQVAHIRLAQQQRPQRRSKPESKIFHFGFSDIKNNHRGRIQLKLKPSKN
jgi:hypothetical protein